MIIDTIFICFCEDCEKNDGISRPYFMSRGLMVRISCNGRISIIISYRAIYEKKSCLIQEFVENSKKALRQLEHRDVAAT